MTTVNTDDHIEDVIYQETSLNDFPQLLISFFSVGIVFNYR